MSQLTTNTATIDELITIANNLPDAGSGGEDVTDETTAYTNLLDDLEDAVNALPDAGGGGGSGGVETCTLTIVAPDAPPPPLPITLIATDGNMNPISIPPTTAGDYKIAKNTLLYFQSSFINFTGSYDAVYEDGPFVVRVTGDCSFEMLG